MSKKETKDRITREKEMLPEMVKIYCHGVHKTKGENFAPSAVSCATMRFTGSTTAVGGMKRISAPSARAIAISPPCAKR